MPVWSFFTSSSSEKKIFLAGYYYCALARLFILFSKPEKYLGKIGKYMSDPESVTKPESADYSQMVINAIRRVTKYSLWNNNCLSQAVGAKRLLNNRGIPSTLYLGVRKVDEDKKKLEAHAWLKSGDIIITGGKSAGNFETVAWYS